MKVDQQIADLTSEVASNTTLVASAVLFVQGVPALIQAAVDLAIAKGATEAQLAPFDGLITALKENDTTLANALVAGTPAAPLANVAPSPAVAAAVAAVPGADPNAVPATPAGG